MRKFGFAVPYASCLIVATVGLVAMFLWSAHRAAQHAPEFYIAALGVDSRQYRAAGSQLERRLLLQRGHCIGSNDWAATFTEDQVNGWIAIEFPNTFPGVLPPSVIDPRVAIEKDRVRLAFRYQSNVWSGIVTLEAHLRCTDDPNQIAIVVESVRSGFLYIPVAPWREWIAHGFKQAGAPLTWSEENGRVVAIVQLPDRLTALQAGNLVVEEVVLREGAVSIIGQTTWHDESTFRVAQRPDPHVESATRVNSQ